MNQVFDVMGAIVTLALVTTLVSHPGTSRVIRAGGDAFSGSLRAATRF